MTRETQLRAAAVVLALCTVAVIVFGAINFDKEGQFVIPDDGVWWLENSGQLVAERVNPQSPGEHAGIKSGDSLSDVNGQAIHSTADLERNLFQTGTYARANYGLVRKGVRLEAPVILVPPDRSLYTGLRLIALIYLGIGIYVLLRRWSAPKSTHFFVFCLVSCVFYAFHYTGKLNAFDQIIYWSSIVASALQPALFLHFALTFPETKDWVRRHRWLIPALYMPAMLVIGAYVLAVTLLAPSGRLQWNLDRLDVICSTTSFVLAALVLLDTYRKSTVPLLRQQMKWVTRGTVLAIAPYTLFSVIPYLLGGPQSAI
ncbi:MAG: PDZ domain-containing protein, partial [Acidobacteria bacterium]|nr:PDZ domain-containing protein [Acidobacteriota bacterium]